MIRKVQIILMVFLLVGVSYVDAQMTQHEWATASITGNESGYTSLAKKKRLKPFLEKLEQSHDVSFMYESGLLEQLYVSSEFKLSGNFGKDLQALLESVNLTYTRLNKTTFVIQADLSQQIELINSHQVTGNVTSAKTGKALIGVNILVKGTSVGAATDNKGHYELVVPSAQDTLVVSYVGYKTRQVPIQNRSTINVSLAPTTVMDKGITVVAYGEQSTETVTNSITSVSSENISKIPSGNIGNALAGQTPGLETIQRTGQPGGDTPEIYVRGVSSLSAGRSTPLFVLDGVVVRDARSITQLDPDNVKSVSVLKDASATAVYGVEGANGVVLVETKRGKKGTAQISVNTSTGFQAPAAVQEYADSYTHALGYNEAQINDGVDPENVRFQPEVVEAFRTGSNPIIYPDINWLDYLTKPASLQSRTNINISGGGEDVRYYVAGGYLKQDGFFKTFSSDYDFNPSYDRYNFRSNLDIDVTPKTHLSLTGAGRIGQRIFKRGLNWTNVYRAVPFAGAGLIDDKLVVSSNKYIPGPKEGVFQRIYGQGYNKEIRSVLNLNLSGTQDLDAITKGLQLKLKGAYNVYYTEVKFRNSDIATYQPYFRTDVDSNTPGDSSIVYQKHGTDEVLQYGEGYGRDRDWYMEARLQYNRDFNLHNVKGLLMYNQRKSYYPNSFQSIPRGLVSAVGRINYNYSERYLLEASLGYNGSENFAKERRFGFFPSVSGGWILTNEPYMPDLSFLSFLKLRASYGLVGNDTGIGRFLYLPDQYKASSDGYNFGYQVPQDRPGASEGRLGNPLVTWETARKQNYGVNLRLFNDKLGVSFDYFHELRSDILIQLNTVPEYVAADLPAVNVGKVQNKGYEAEVEWQQQAGDFYYSIGANVAFARNKVLYMDEVPRNEPYQRRTGERVGQDFGYVFDRYFTAEDFEEGADFPEHPWNPKPGDLKFKDLNGDGVVDGDDQAPIGYPDRPEYTFGSNLHFSYKNIDLSMTWAAVTNTSRELAYVPYRTAFGPRGGRSLPQFQWDGRWTPEKGQDATFPRLSLASRGRRNNTPSSFWMVDASYIRLKNIEIGYNFSPTILQKFGLRNLRLYMNGYNLLTFSKMQSQYSIDPEQSANSFNQQYPVMKVYNFGVKIDI